jgi:hypothetical protein
MKLGQEKGNATQKAFGAQMVADHIMAALSGTPSRGETVGSTARPATQAQMEEARRHFAYVMFASFCALLLGAGAAYAAGISTTSAAIKEAARPVT